ncbi:hypothetical protein LZP69_01330 [Shewanella sp. AS1]|uniref:hypothetical protein n=1 Tax=Shewanella sp. AS1 TaxID=2907626 RepID=UPI001F418288|nr:hypothetical protein [Shewanella sp. AS1]MCE9677834.1 hypothetical protein [Shewanella sp. AS1]
MSCLSISHLAFAGEVVVRKSSEAFDAFAVKQQVLKEHHWRELLRMQQQIEILQALPSGCLFSQGEASYFLCAGGSYLPYLYSDPQGGEREVYIRVAP